MVQVHHFCGPLFKIVEACGPQPARNCSKSWCSSKKKKAFTWNWSPIFQFSSQNHSLLLLLLFSDFPFSQGWPQRIIILQTFPSSTSVFFAPTSPYLLLLHLKIFSLVSLFSSFLVTPFPSSFFLHTLGLSS